MRAGHLTLADFSRQMLSAFTSVDGKLLRSLRWLLTRPGALSSAYVAGRRKPFLGPLALFLMANGLFFGLQSALSTDVFSSTLDSHLHQQDWSALAQRLVDQRLAVRRMSLAEFSPLFDQAAVLHAKSLIILMVLMFAAVLAVVFWRRREPFGAHLVFALHLYAFQLLLFCVALLMAQADVLAGGLGLQSHVIDMGLTLFNLCLSTVYLWLATRATYGVRGVVGALQTLALAVSASALVLAYRFIVFLITLYTT